jgi:hypothetical protein
MVLTWSKPPAEQKAFIAQLDLKLQQIGLQVVPETLYSETEPTAAELAEGLYKRTQWVDPATNTLKNGYTRIEDAVGAASTTYTAYPIVPAPRGRVLTKIDEISVGATAGLATLTFSDIPQTFEHLYLYVHYRDTNAAVSAACNLRINGLATATYAMSWQGHNGNQSYGAESISATGWPFVAPGGTSVSHFFLDGWYELPTYSAAARSARMRGKVSTAWGATFSATTVQGYDAFGVQTSLAAITSLSWVGVTGSAPGTRLVLFGM